MLGSTGAYTRMGQWWDVSLSKAVPALQIPQPDHCCITPKSSSTAPQTGKTSLALPKTNTKGSAGDWDVLGPVSVKPGAGPPQGQVHPTFRRFSRAQLSISSLLQHRTGGYWKDPSQGGTMPKEEGMRLLKISNSTYFQIFLAAKPCQSLPLKWKAPMALVLYQISTHTVCCSIHPLDLDGNRLARLHASDFRG